MYVNILRQTMELHDIEATIKRFYNAPPDPETIQRVEAWNSDTTWLRTAVALLLNSTEECVRFFTVCAISNFIDNEWIAIDGDFLGSVRGDLMQFVFQAKPSGLVTEKMCSIIACLGFNHWPMRWPSFFQDVMSCADAADLNTRPGDAEWAAEVSRCHTCVLTIFGNLAIKLGRPEQVTMARRARIVGAMRTQCAQLMDFVENHSYPTGHVPDALVFFEPFCLLVTDDAVMTQRLIAFLVEQFVNITSTGFKALTNLLVRAKQDRGIFVMTVKLIDAMMQANIPDCAALIKFACKYMSASHNMFHLYARDVDFVTAVRRVLGSVVTGLPGLFMEEIWELWAAIMYAAMDTNSRLCSSMRNMIEPVLPIAIAGLYDMLSMCLVEGKLVHYKVMSVFTAFSMVIDAMMVAFLREREMSTSLCVALGLLRCLGEDESFKEILDARVPVMIREAGFDIQAVLFALSRNVRYIQSNPEIFKATINLISQAIMCDVPATVTTALVALDRIVDSYPNCVIVNTMDFVHFMATSVYFVREMEEENVYRVTKFLAKIAVLIEDPETAKQLMDLLVAPVGGMLNNDDMTVVMRGCKVGEAMCMMSSIKVQLIMQQLWEPLFRALEKAQTSPWFASLCIFFARTICSSSWELAEDVVKRFIAFATNVANQDEAIIEALVYMKRSHNEIGQFRPFLLERFVTNICRTPNFAVLRFFDTFHVLEAERAIVIPLICACVKSCDRRVSKTSIWLVRDVHRHNTLPIESEALFVSSLVESFFDGTHTTTWKHLISGLFVVTRKMVKRGQPAEQVLLGVFSRYIDNEETAQKFVVALKNLFCSEDKFSDLMTSFLVAAGRCNPCEIAFLCDGVTVSEDSKQESKH